MFGTGRFVIIVILLASSWTTLKAQVISIAINGKQDRGVHRQPIVMKFENNAGFGCHAKYDTDRGWAPTETERGKFGSSTTS